MFYLFGNNLFSMFFLIQIKRRLEKFVQASWLVCLSIGSGVSLFWSWCISLAPPDNLISMISQERLENGEGIFPKSPVKSFPKKNIINFILPFRVKVNLEIYLCKEFFVWKLLDLNVSAYFNKKSSKKKYESLSV